MSVEKIDARLEVDANGAREVERHGLTRNQREGLNELHEAWREYDQ